MLELELNQKVTRLMIATHYLNQNAIALGNGEITCDEYTQRQKKTWEQVCDALNSFEEN